MKKIISVFIVLIIIILSIGCVEKKVCNQNVRSYMVYGVKKLPKDLLMLDNEEIREQDILIALFEGLVSKNENGDIIPALAEKWSISGDKLTYTFKIRENAKWNDGTKITSQNFVEFLLRLLREEKNLYSSQLYCIFGAKDYANRKCDKNSVAIVARNDNTLDIRLNYPCDYFLEILSEPVFFLRENFFNLREWRKEYKKIRYSGPFIIENIYGNNEISLKKNKNYWDDKNVKSDKINIKGQKIDAFSLADYKSNKTDIITSIPLGEINNFSDDEKVTRNKVNKGLSINFNMYQDNSVLLNKNFRIAIKYCIDKGNIEKQLNGIIKQSNHYIPWKSNDMNLDSNKQDKNIIKAKKFLKESNYDGEVIKVVYDSSNDYFKHVAECLEEDLKELKLNIEIKPLDKSTLNTIIAKGEYSIFITNYIAYYDSEMAFLEKWISNSKINIYGYKNSEFDNEISKNNFKGAEKILLNDIPTIPIGFYNISIYKKNNINGVIINKQGNVILKNIYYDK